MLVQLGHMGFQWYVVALALLVVAEGWRGRGGGLKEQQQQAKVVLEEAVEAERVLMSSQGAVLSTLA